jgi:hypothetical protein
VHFISSLEENDYMYSIQDFKFDQCEWIEDLNKWDFPPCVTLNKPEQNPDKIGMIHDKAERKEFLEDTKGFLPEPTGINCESPLVDNDQVWWKSINVSNLSPARAEKLLNKVKQFPGAFAKSDTELGTFKYFTANLPDKPGATTPVHDKYRPVGKNHEANAQESIDKLLNMGAVRPSSSHYAANLIMVKKKTGPGPNDVKYRACFDGRSLNKQLLECKWPNSSMQECLTRVSNAKYKSFCDLQLAYHQLVLAEEDRHKTAFYGPALAYTNIPEYHLDYIAAFQHF